PDDLTGADAAAAALGAAGVDRHHRRQPLLGDLGDVAAGAARGRDGGSRCRGVVAAAATDRHDHDAGRDEDGDDAGHQQDDASTGRGWDGHASARPPTVVSSVSDHPAGRGADQTAAPASSRTSRSLASASPSSELWITSPPYWLISGSTLSGVTLRTRTISAAPPGCSFSPNSLMNWSLMPTSMNAPEVPPAAAPTSMPNSGTRNSIPIRPPHSAPPAAPRAAGLCA